MNKSLLALFLLGSLASAAFAQQIAPAAPDDLAQLAQQAAAAAPRTGASLPGDRQNLLAAIQRVEYRFAQNAKSAQSWQNYLQLDQFRKLAADDNLPAPHELNACRQRIRCAVAVWPNEDLIALRTALERFGMTLRVVHDGDHAAAYQQRIDQLAALLAGPLEDLSDEQFAQIADLANWFSQRGEALPLVLAVQAKFLKPNFVFQLSQTALESELSAPFNEKFNVNRAYVGTPMRGSGSITGTVAPKLVQTVAGGAIDILLDAQAVATTSGNNSGVQVTSTARTGIRGIKRIMFDQNGLQSQPALVRAKSIVDYNNIAAGGRFGRNRAVSEVYAQRASAESESAAEAENGARARLDDFAGKRIGEINDAYRRAILNPLVARNVWPRDITSRVVDKQLCLEALQANGNELGPRIAPPPFPAPPDASLQIHVSGIERLGRDLLAGRHFHGAELAEFIAGLQGRPKSASDPAPNSPANNTPTISTPAPSSSGPEILPSQSPAEKSTDWGLTFDSIRPLEIAIENGTITCTLRLSDFQSEGKEYPGMKVSAIFHAALAEGAAQFVRPEKLAIYPLDFTPRSGQKLTGPQQVMCKILSRRLENVIVREYAMRSLFPDQAFSRLAMAQVTADHQWLTVGMQLPRLIPIPTEVP